MRQNENPAKNIKPTPLPVKETKKMKKEYSVSYSFADYNSHLDEMLRSAYDQGRDDAVHEALSRVCDIGCVMVPFAIDMDLSEISISALKAVKKDVIDILDCMITDNESIYRWHNIIKHKDDLPKDGRQVLVAYDADDFDISEYWARAGGWGKKRPRVIAWKYIEAPSVSRCLNEH